MSTTLELVHTNYTLTGDPQYQMVAQAYPFVVRKVLRNDSNGSMSLLQDILFDNDGKVG